MYTDPFSVHRQYSAFDDGARPHTTPPSYLRTRSHATAPPKPRPQHNDHSWARIAETYAWLIDAELRDVGILDPTESTHRWVLEQQLHAVPPPPPPPPPTRLRRYPRVIFETRTDAPRPHPPLFTLGGPTRAELDAEIARFEARAHEARRRAERQVERTRLLQEEFGRMEARWQERGDRARQHLVEEHRRAEERERRAAQLARVEAEQIAEAWPAYERRWALLGGGEGPLTFRTVPWPVLRAPRTVADLTDEAIAVFLLSPAHSRDLSRKERIKRALRRWHPDRFGRYIGRVEERDREMVDAGVGLVVRCLNDLLEKS